MKDSKFDLVSFLRDHSASDVPCCKYTNSSRCFSSLPKHPKDYINALRYEIFNPQAIFEALKSNKKYSRLDANWVALQLRIEFERTCSLFRFLYVNYDDQDDLHYLFHRLFSLDYFLSRMIYRCSKDIFGKHRSCLKKIYERDDSSSKPMVLYVSDIFYRCNDPVGELWLECCDGWYFGEFKIDPHISSLVRSGKIFVGQKLALLYSEV